MEAPSKDHIYTLVDQFITMLDDYKPIELGELMNPVDVFFAFRILFRRNPDPLLELPQLLSSPLTMREFMRNLMDSPEFSYTGGLMPSGQFLMAEVEGFRFWFNTGDREMGVLMGFGLYEPASVALVKKLVRPGMKCIDIGAQTGFYTCLMASLVGPEGKVFSFEPMPPSYDLLMRNIKENGFEGRTSPYPMAASNAATTLEASFVSNMYVAGDIPGVEKVQMEAVRIDDVVKERIDVIKMDVEGHEPAAIEGMKELILRDRPILLTEANQYWLNTCSQSSANEYLDLLLSLNYNVFPEDDLKTPLKSGDLNLDVLGNLNIVALPR